jgi:hypothetical protein
VFRIEEPTMSASSEVVPDDIASPRLSDPLRRILPEMPVLRRHQPPFSAIPGNKCRFAYSSTSAGRAVSLIILKTSISFTWKVSHPKVSISELIEYKPNVP